MKVYDSIIIGGGQAGLSVGYYLRRGKLDYLILDDQEKPGGAWLKTWDSLKLFSPVQYSSLSGWMMPKSNEEYPSKNEFVNYLEAYEKRYQFPVERPVSVIQVTKHNDIFHIETNKGIFYSKTVVSATGTTQHPYIPSYTGRELFEGTQIHSVEYKNVNLLHGKKVLIVGGGNSGAQILAEVSKVAHTQWVTLHEPHFLPEEIDGRYLFHQATQKYLNPTTTNPNKKASLSDIVMVDSVKEAYQRDVLHAVSPFESFFENGVIWKNGNKEAFDVVIWCTGFKAQFDHLKTLNVIENGRIPTEMTRSVKEPNLWLVGYGNWTGFASATIYGVGKTARQTGAEIMATLKT